MTGAVGCRAVGFPSAQVLIRQCCSKIATFPTKLFPTGLARLLMGALVEPLVGRCGGAVES